MRSTAFRSNVNLGMVWCGRLQLIRAMDKAYVISVNSVEDIKNLYRSLGLVRSLLMVQVGPDEEDLLKQSIWYASRLPAQLQCLRRHELFLTYFASQYTATFQTEILALRIYILFTYLHYLLLTGIRLPTRGCLLFSHVACP